MRYKLRCGTGGFSIEGESDQERRVDERLPGQYRITVRGSLDFAWSMWFEEMEIYPDADGNTTISGFVKDDAELYGLISKARDLGLGLLSVVPLKAEDRRQS